MTDIRRVVSAFVVATVLVAASGPLLAANSAAQEDCLVTQAADQAVQRRIAMIDAAKVNPQDFFKGENSCISPQLMQSFDLSRFIPDLAGFLTGGIESLVSSVLSQAKQQVCNVLNEQMNSLLGNLNGAGACFQSGLSADMASVLGGFSSIGSPNSSCGVGQYNVGGLGSTSGSYGSVFGNIQSTTTAASTAGLQSGGSVAQSNTQSVVTDTPATAAQTGGDTLVDSLTSIFSR